MALPYPRPAAISVVTGASQGIGRELARDLARRGYNVMVIARREDKLTELKHELEAAHGITSEVYPCDLSDPVARKQLCDELTTRDVQVLCTSAGIATFGKLIDLDPVYERAQVELNVFGVYDLTMAVLPGMVERQEGGILNVGSAAGNMAIPNNATYVGTKAFVNGFTESLRGELRGSGVHVTLLAPGPVRTETPAPEDASIVDKMVPDFLWTDADDCARESLDALGKNKMRIVPGPLSKLMNTAGIYTPRKFTAPIIGKFYSGMAE